MEENKYIEKLIKEYSKKELSQLDELKALDKKAKLPANMFAYVFGVIGALVLGLGMCLAMNILGSSVPLMVVGIIVGLIGIVMVSINYFLYRKILDNSKSKHSEKILAISNELLNK